MNVEKKILEELKRFNQINSYILKEQPEAPTEPEGGVPPAPEAPVEGDVPPAPDAAAPAPEAPAADAASISVYVIPVAAVFSVVGVESATLATRSAP